MKIDCLVLGEYETNCYVLRSGEAATDCLIVDPGLGAEELIAFLDERKMTAVAAALTHGHIDHIAGLAALRRSFPDIKVFIHALDAEMLGKPVANLSGLMGRAFAAEPADILLNDGDWIEQARVKLQVLHTPGHSPGGICLYSSEEGVVFTDDALFAESIGRTDFPGGSMSRLVRSIKEKLWVLSDETVVYPGHGPSTTIAREKAHNPFLQ
ncbi:MAG TPA: MBL fold metallo-hydrolase [Sedimentisphaerales bacterium]|nr:MBL fold metallo-hydrolase [Sedimentisphaerales bacterium]